MSLHIIFRVVRNFCSVSLFWVLLFAPAAVYCQENKAAVPLEWDKLVDAAKKEGKVTVSIPASAEMKKQVEEQFKKRYGIEVETFTARGSAGVRRMADEFKAGVRHFDLHIGGSSSIISGMLNEGILDPIEPWLALASARVRALRHLKGPYGMCPVAIQTSLSRHSPYLIDVVAGVLGYPIVEPIPIRIGNHEAVFDNTDSFYAALL